MIFVGPYLCSHFRWYLCLSQCLSWRCEARIYNMWEESTEGIFPGESGWSWSNIYKKNRWCLWNIQQKFDNFSSCPTINTSLSWSSLSSLGEKIPSMINSRSNQRCADIFIRSPPPSTIVLEMILSRAGPDHIWKDNRKLRNGDLVIGLFQFQFCHQNTTNPLYISP